MAHLLGAEGLHLEYPTKEVFRSVTLGIDEGQRIGVVGRNGDGKSTLLALLAQRITPDAGRVTSRRGLNVGVLSQSDELDPHHTVGHAVVGTAAEHSWAGDARMRDIIESLAGDIAWDAKVGELSGGQRRRVDLAALLIGDHDILMLDEPTNHLDMDAITWLAQHLNKRWSKNAGGLVLVTHDRWFLDEVSTSTWEVHDGVVEEFEGGYAAYVLQRAERDRMAAVSEAKRQNLMQKELAWLRRGPPARTSKPKFRIDAANALIADEPPARDPLLLERLAANRLGKDVIDIHDVSVAFGDKEILREVNWHIAPGERVGILGINGAGKSTLLRLITRELEPTSGRVKHGKTVKVATLDQLSTGLESVANERVNDVVARKRASYKVGGKELGAAQLLERLGFTTTHLSSPVKDLSGGQKRRLQLLLILLDEPNVLVMDEPSNDLDTDMLAAMEDLLDSWPGSLVVVSHDRYLMERVTDNQYAVIDNRLRHLPGGVDQYLSLQQTPRLRSTTKTNTGAGAGADRHADAKELAAVERKLAKLPSQIVQAEQRIADHDQTDYEGLAGLAQTAVDLKAKQADLEHRWLELSEKLE